MLKLGKPQIKEVLEHFKVTDFILKFAASIVSYVNVIPFALRIKFQGEISVNWQNQDNFQGFLLFLYYPYDPNNHYNFTLLNIEMAEL